MLRWACSRGGTSQDVEVLRVCALFALHIQSSEKWLLNLRPFCITYSEVAASKAVVSMTV